MGEIIIDEKKCVGDEICVDKCPMNVLEMNAEGKKKKAMVARLDDCIECHTCELECPYRAIQVLPPLGGEFEGMKTPEGAQVTAESSKDFNTAIPPLQDFEPQQTAQDLWDIVSKNEFSQLEEVYGINIAQFNQERQAKLAEQGFTLKGDRIFLTNDKIEKFVLGWIIIRDAMLICTCMGWPRDGYDFPVLSVTWDESEKHVHMIADFMPLTDLIMDEWYLEKYLDPVEPTFKRYTDLLEAPAGNLSWFRAISSPYVIVGRNKADDGRARIKRSLKCVCAYVSYWFDEIVAKAEPVTDEQYRDRVIAKKEKIKNIYHRQDPGGPVMTALVGKELAFKGLKLLF